VAKTLSVRTRTLALAAPILLWVLLELCCAVAGSRLLVLACCSAWYWAAAARGVKSHSGADGSVPDRARTGASAGTLPRSRTPGGEGVPTDIGAPPLAGRGTVQLLDVADTLDIGGDPGGWPVVLVFPHVHPGVGERNSKWVVEHTRLGYLYREIRQMASFLVGREGRISTRMDVPHVQLVRDATSVGEIVTRARQLHLRRINPLHPDRLGFTADGRCFSLSLGEVGGYGRVHMTLAYKETGAFTDPERHRLIRYAHDLCLALDDRVQGDLTFLADVSSIRQVGCMLRSVEHFECARRPETALEMVGRFPPSGLDGILDAFRELRLAGAGAFARG